MKSTLPPAALITHNWNWKDPPAAAAAVVAASSSSIILSIIFHQHHHHPLSSSSSITFCCSFPLLHLSSTFCFDSFLFFPLFAFHPSPLLFFAWSPPFIMLLFLARRISIIGGALAGVYLYNRTQMKEQQQQVLSDGSATAEAPVKEPGSGRSFQRRMQLVSGAMGQLLGSTCRRKFGVLPVYGLGLYVNELDVASLNKPEDILKGHVEAELQLKFCRSVDDTTILSSIKNAMQPRLPIDQHPSLDRFIATLNEMYGGPLQSGATLGFHWRSGVLTCYMEYEPHQNRTELGIKSDHLANALFAVYLDEKAIIPEARKAFAQGLHQPAP
eukprot:m.222366 g.222366  ORF g.222366 m.222366 type:complete len:328 (+) comp17020_c2_seq4:808-1791(+)